MPTRLLSVVAQQARRPTPPERSIIASSSYVIDKQVSKMKTAILLYQSLGCVVKISPVLVVAIVVSSTPAYALPAENPPSYLANDYACAMVSAVSEGMKDVDHKLNEWIALCARHPNKKICEAERRYISSTGRF